MRDACAIMNMEETHHNTSPDRETPWWENSVGQTKQVPATAPLQLPVLDARPDFGTKPLPPLEGTPTPARHALYAAGLRDVGQIRSVNQDSFYTFVTSLPRETGDVPCGLFVVADGMGGHEGGEIASRLAVGAVAHHVLQHLVVPALDDGDPADLQAVITSAVERANHDIWDYAQQHRSDMGTTCTAVLLLGSSLYIGHVGDSRAYILDPRALRCLTSDHSAVGRLIELGQLTQADARTHPSRSQLYRTVGQTRDVHVDYYYQRIGDASHLLLASDGLWGMLEDAELARTLRSATWPHDACQTLVRQANAAGGEDNITAIVVALPTAP